MKCVICEKVSDPWLQLRNENLYVDVEGNPKGDTIQTCSYLCTRKCQGHLPNNYSHLVLNKEDFCYLRPVLTKSKPKFEYLTLDEIMKLTDDEKVEYYTQKEEYMSMDSEKQDIINEIEAEDYKTMMVEQDCYSENDSDYTEYDC